MKEDIIINSSVTIPWSELVIRASKAGGPGGQHVNKSDTRITIRWNLYASTALNEEQKTIVANNLASKLTTEGDLVIHNRATRSQQQNKKNALDIFAETVRAALKIPKKRKKTKLSREKKEARLQEKKKRSKIKETRKKKIDY